MWRPPVASDAARNDLLTVTVTCAARPKIASSGTKRDSVLALSNDDVRAVFDIDDCGGLLEKEFAKLGRGEVVNPPRVDRSIRCGPRALDGGPIPPTTG